MVSGIVSDTLRAGWNGFLELLYPSQCEGCGTWGEPPLCDTCIEGLDGFETDVCFVCPTARGNAGCDACAAAEREWGGWAFDRASATFAYTGTLRHLVHVFKYRGVSTLGPLLGALMTQAILDAGKDFPWDVVLPVPGEPGRTRQRGYNPARLLARPIAEEMACRILTEDTVRRTRRSRSQMGLSAEQRRCAGERFGFIVRDPTEVAGKAVLVVDDVFTTGSTVQALATVLKGAGAKTVGVLCLAAGR
ncbi:MAG: ComF family protein [Armatimonadaceae bacterium]